MAQKTKSAGENFSAAESYAIRHHFNYPATIDHQLPGARIEDCQQYFARGDGVRAADVVRHE